MSDDETYNVDLKVRTEIRCACGDTHPIIEWSTWGAYAYVPVIECKMVAPGNVMLIDTNYIRSTTGHGFPDYRGKLWVIGNG